MLDEELLDDVGTRLFRRCQSILEVDAAKQGRVHCVRWKNLGARRLFNASWCLGRWKLPWFAPCAAGRSPGAITCALSNAANSTWVEPETPSKPSCRVSLLSEPLPKRCWRWTS